MKITKVETFVLSDKLKESFFFSQWAYSERRICIVKISTDEGISGWGEGYGPADVLQAGIKLIAPLLSGKNPLENETLWFDMYRKTLDYARRGILCASISAIDVALWDIKGKTLNQPISVLMSGQHRKKVVPYATGLYFSETDRLAEKLAEEAKGYVSQGFKAIKMKVGYTIKKDLEHVKAVREAIGDEVELMIDANHAYSLREATALCRLLEPFNIGAALKIGNSGQICVAPNQFFVHESVIDEFIIGIKGKFENAKIGFGRENKPDMGPLANAGSLKKIHKIVQEAINQGGELVYGGKPIDGIGYYFEPTAIRLNNNNAEILQHEIFGPVALIASFKTKEEVLELANNTDAGLASYVFSKNEDTLNFFAEKLEFGEVQLNGVKYDIYLPHGGVKNSGIGVDCSTFALDDYLVKKRVTKALNPA